MKNYRALAGVILRVAIIIGMWIWLFSLPQNSGSLGYVLFVPFLLAFTVILFYGAIFRLNDFIMSVKRTNSDTAAPVKSRRTLIGTAVQGVLIIITAGLLKSVGGLYMGLTVIAVFVVFKLVDK